MQNKGVPAMEGCLFLFISKEENYDKWGLAD